MVDGDGGLQVLELLGGMVDGDGGLQVLELLGDLVDDGARRPTARAGALAGQPLDAAEAVQEIEGGGGGPLRQGGAWEGAELQERVDGVLRGGELPRPAPQGKGRRAGRASAFHRQGGQRELEGLEGLGVAESSNISRKVRSGAGGLRAARRAHLGPTVTVVLKRQLRPGRHSWQAAGPQGRCLRRSTGVRSCGGG